MNRSTGWIVLALALLAVVPQVRVTAQTAPDAGATTSDEASWREDLATWRAGRERIVSAPDGWLTLVGLEWLKPGFNSFGAAQDNLIQVRAQSPAHMGLLTVSGGKAATGKSASGQAAATNPILQLLAPTGGFPPDLTVDGSPAREGQLAVTVAKPTVIAWHGLKLAVQERGGRFALRIQDADAPTRAGFRNLNWYAPDARFRVMARWIPFVAPHTEKIPTGQGTTLDLPTPGIAEFTLDGQLLHLAPVMEDREGKTLFFILRDRTSQTATYADARFLHTGLPDHGLDKTGTLTLDFNRLENPACAYTPYANCPQPPEVNRLAVAIEAGEKLYAH
ncbi:MAG: DUF1684 domain-containing protein [Terracidiphilus sp.]|jgi:uncharacterized protein (DUF1684 family)